jgi:septal ring factor EnvC (AmiA/AmiB activator)
MTKPFAALFLTLALAAAPLGAAAETVAEAAARTSQELISAVDALGAAEKGKDRISALTQTIRAYEDGLAALREALRQTVLRQDQIAQRFAQQRDQIAQLLGVLSRIDGDDGPLLLIHPSGPLGTVRSGMMLADVTPALQAEADRLGAELGELQELRTLQAEAGRVLTTGLAAATDARSALSTAISDRTELPRKFTEDTEELRRLLESADTLEALAGGLALDADRASGFEAAKGTLELPVRGRVLLHPGETDSRDVVRPGYMFLTRANALVTAPWPATIRYRGPLLDYGNVMVLEPGDGYLLILGGLDRVFGEVGEVVATGAALGLMGGTEAGTADLLATTREGGAADETERLYLELRRGSDAIDPTEWFAPLKAAL